VRRPTRQCFPDGVLLLWMVTAGKSERYRSAELPEDIDALRAALVAARAEVAVARAQQSESSDGRRSAAADRKVEL
jgi:hypothetical protein